MGGSSGGKGLSRGPLDDAQEVLSTPAATAGEAPAVRNRSCSPPAGLL